MHRKQHAKRIDKSRGTPAERGYDSKWVKIRLAYLREHRLCVVCGQLADMVDHIVPIKDGGTHDVDNLQPMCTACHRVKTNTLDGGYGNRREGRSNP